MNGWLRQVSCKSLKQENKTENVFYSNDGPVIVGRTTVIKHVSMVSPWSHHVKNWPVRATKLC